MPPSPDTPATRPPPARFSPIPTPGCARAHSGPSYAWAGRRRKTPRAALADVDPRAPQVRLRAGRRLPGADFAALLDDPDDIVVEAACFAVGEIRD